MEKKRALVYGLGNMGMVVAWSMEQFGYHVIGLDQRQEMGMGMPPSVDFLPVKDDDDATKTITLTNPDIIISSLPYNHIEKVALASISKGIPYCDLGGSVPVSKKVNDFGRTQKTPVFTDLGLAPGWVNILAEHGCNQLLKSGEEIEEVKMMVGGIPETLQVANNPLNYMTTWSIDGLINEYRDDCYVLENGARAKKKGMEGLEHVWSKCLNTELEAFYTSGGAAHSSASMKERGIANCSYKTLRYQGHCELVKFLIRDCALEDETLTQIFNACRNDPQVSKSMIPKDLVLIKVLIRTKTAAVWDKEVLIRFGGDNNMIQFSAMQKATAFSASSVAKEMIEGSFDEIVSQTYGKRCLAYKDVDYEQFMKNIEFLKSKVETNDIPYEQS
jgi:saccharopine dehydrogenase-like NADP-dependent oxidoreductase